MNAFESARRKVIPAVLVYLRSARGILMLHRDSGRAGDDHSGKWNGLGGKLEADESPIEAARREVFEEAGIQVSSDALRPLGVLQFPNFKPRKNEDWVVFVFSGKIEANEPLVSGSEGSLHWVEPCQLLSLNLWPGDRHFISYVVEGRPFLGTIWYEDRTVKRYLVQELTAVS